MIFMVSRLARWDWIGRLFILIGLSNGVPSDMAVKKPMKAKNGFPLSDPVLTGNGLKFEIFYSVTPPEKHRFYDPVFLRVEKVTKH